MFVVAIVLTAALLFGPVLGAQDAADSAAIADLVARRAGAVLLELGLSDSSGARFELDAPSSWRAQVYAAIRQHYPRTGRPVADSTYATALRVELPVFRGDSATVTVTWRRCYPHAPSDSSAFFRFNYVEWVQHYHFARAPAGGWERVIPLRVTEEVGDGVCGARARRPPAG